MISSVAHAAGVYRQQYRQALGKAHGAGPSARDEARLAARMGYFIVRRARFPSWEAFWERATRGLADEYRLP